jgi:hypothetical protein
MEEQLLHFIWHRKLFDVSSLTTTENEPVEILHTGVPNADQGPDFLQARIRIGGQLWAGHVEIHIRSSSWYLHTHQQDAHYNNVILHVVWLEDQPALTSTGYRIPCIALAQKVDQHLLQRYHHLMNNQEWIPCASSLVNVQGVIKTTWLERMMAERLEYKTTHIQQVLDRCGQHWEQTFFVMLARQLGAPANGDAMETLCQKIPWSIMRKHGDRTDQIEALLFGTAGMLEKEMNDPYVKTLKREFDFLKKKYQITAMPGLHWKFMRMRPVHFPTIRIAQLAVMIKAFDHFIALLEEMEGTQQWIDRFMVKPAHSFWETHYHFTSASPKSEKLLGKNTASVLVINVVAPIMFLYGKYQGKPKLKDHALDLLRQLPAEENGIISGWKKCGWKTEDAGQTQGLLHLKKEYCDKRRCMHCAIGLKVLQ